MTDTTLTRPSSAPRARGLAVTVAVALTMLLGAVLAAAGLAGPAQASSTCGARHAHSYHTIQYCPVWLPSGGVPVFYSPLNHTVIGHLRVGGSANWFYCQDQVLGHPTKASGYTSDWYAQTLPDDYTSSKYSGRIGFVSGVYYDGSTTYFNGLESCGP